MALELGEARDRLVVLLRDLPHDCRAWITKERAWPSKSHGWSYERIADWVERLAVYSTRDAGDEVSSRLVIARLLHSQMSRAREALVVGNVGIVVLMARQAFTGAVPVQDLIQDGYLGLLEAIDRFDPRHGAKFSTYAGWWIRRALNEAFYRGSRMIRIPAPLRRALGQLGRTKNELRNRLRRDPTDREVADCLGLSLEKLEGLRHLVAEPKALEDLGAGSVAGEWARFLAAPTAPDPLEAALRDEAHCLAREAVRRLPPRERAVIELRFGFDGREGLMLREIAQVLGLSRERVRQIEAQALGKLARWARRARVGRD